MQYAINDKNEKIKVRPNGRAICPNCRLPLIAKCGQLNIWHWAHMDLKECDDWNYEPITDWHLEWQGHFSSAETEVFIKQNNESHRADILNKENIVIEIQNSPIQANEIHEREYFYGKKMLWVINSKEFKHNLNLKEYPFNASTDVWFKKVIMDHSDNTIKALVPISLGDDVKKALLKHKFSLYKIDRDNEIWKKSFYGGRTEIPSDILNIFKNLSLDEKFLFNLYENKTYSTNFRWLHLRKCWTVATNPIFIDLNNGFLLYIKTLYENGNGYAKIISKRNFLKKYSSNK
ncbi:competence CoiA-like predicted nuclease [Chitinophaga sp. W3I9]|uniref:competence protein CoiA n=1 Tax=Chitinophaga sp. W3I9 TaxID=3373924 RepID=UPI003D191AD3